MDTFFHDECMGRLSIIGSRNDELKLFNEVCKNIHRNLNENQCRICFEDLPCEFEYTIVHCCGMKLHDECLTKYIENSVKDEKGVVLCSHCKKMIIVGIEFEGKMIAANVFINPYTKSMTCIDIINYGCYRGGPNGKMIKINI